MDVRSVFFVNQILKPTIMKYLIIYAHPNPGSFNHAILETVEAELKKHGHETLVRNLNALNYNPVLSANDFAGLKSGNLPDDIKAEQQHVTWADVLVVIHPVWWTGMPAILKGYFDRTLLYGFAYKFDKNGLVKMLTGKKVLVFSTHGQPKEVYEKEMYNAMNLTSNTGVYEFCGMEVVHHEYFSSVISVDDSARKAYIQKVADILHKTM